jgi:[ribosomal protein S18]-alanine N-acetyltransferase
VRRPADLQQHVRVPLQPFDPACAELVASWASGDEAVVRAWISVESADVPADVVAGWAADDDVEAFLFTESDGGAPVAYGELWLDHEDQDLELARLLVAPERRGKGIGRVFVRALVEHARRTHPELPLVLLRVFPDNTRAIRAYGAAGFVDVPEDEQATWNEGQRFTYHWMVLPH